MQKILILLSLTLFSLSVTAQDEATTPPQDNHVNLLLYTKPFEAVAQKFVEFHKSAENAQTTLISVENIKAKPALFTDRPGHSGYEKQKPEGFEIQNYDYDLALKIAYFLRDYSDKNKIDSVMILGNGGVIPVSYFFYNEYEKDLPAPSNIVEYTSWIGSDHYYAAPDFKLAHRYAVGRVALSTPEEAEAYLAKLKKYKAQTLSKPNNDFIFAGANVVHDYRVMGEMYRVAMHKERVFGKNVFPLMETGGELTREKFMDALVKIPAQFMMFFTHGMGEGIVMADNEQVTVKDIVGLPASDTLKIVFSPSCLNAGFDYANVPLPFDPENKRSIAEAFLLSKVAVAYVGSTRLALADIKFKTERRHGVMEVTEVKYMPDLLLRLLVAYKNGARRLGDAFKLAHQNYMKDRTEEQYMSDPGSRAMYAAYALIGDPVLTMPPFVAGPESQHTGLEILNCDHTQEFHKHFEIPGFTPTNHPLAGPFVVRFGHGNAKVTTPIYFKLVETDSGKLVHEGTINPAHEYQFKPDNTEAKAYIMSSWSLPNGADRVWQYFSVTEADNAHPHDHLARQSAAEKPHRAGGKAAPAPLPAGSDLPGPNVN